MNFEYELNDENGIICIIPSGNLIERYQAKDLLEEVDELILEDKNKFILNLNQLEYLNSSGLSVLLSLLTRSRKAGGEVAICCISERLKKLFLITRLDNVFQVFESPEEAAKVLSEMNNTTQKNEA